MLKDEIAGSCVVEFAGQSLQLLPDQAIYWPARDTLLVADLHFGKDEAFRSAGVPVPVGGTEKDLSRLSSLIGLTGAQRLVILGDLLHARSGCHPDLFDTITAWRRTHQIEMLLIRGNHDRASVPIPAEWRMREAEEPFDDAGITLAHAPREGVAPGFAGHLHPTAQVQDFDGSTLSLPCFVFDERCAILPAFGSFTGGHSISPHPRRRLYLAAAGRVIPLSTR